MSASPTPASSPLSAHLIPGPPPFMYYIPSFITPDQESHLLTRVSSAPLPQWRQLSHRRLQSLPSPLTAQNVLLDAPLPDWLAGLARRIADLHINDSDDDDDDDEDDDDDDDDEAGAGRERESADGKGADKLFGNSPHKAPNHCLVNEYLPGQGIMPHEDGPAYFPITATVSRGSQAVLEVRMKGKRSELERCEQNVPDTSDESSADQEAEESGQTAWRILCEPGSLLITTGDAYVKTLHAIEPVEVDEGICDPKNVMAKILTNSQTRGVANWELLGDHKGWVRDGGCRRREMRVSLTFRDVLKVRSMKAFGGLMGRK